ncbi:MAR-binding filament-like protein 1-1 [Sesamum indicum]|uniref:MAR-binding filament-like protein 1-1 n=1 Tax=Sesamum indicum TaxID=4182 RepID=A0A6I9STG6_SESIN|nr:MAR-binding filament-like protein 1-1 [Sesamum indicum]
MLCGAKPLSVLVAFLFASGYLGSHESKRTVSTKQFLGLYLCCGGDDAGGVRFGCLGFGTDASDGEGGRDGCGDDENDEPGAEDQKQKTKGSSSRNPFCSLLNELGVFCSGVVAGLYASRNKGNVISDAIIESMNNKLKEKEAAIASLEKKFEMELLNEKDVQNKELAKANLERQSLVDRLNLARHEITRMGQALEKEKSLYRELTIQAHDLENSLKEAGNEKRELQEQLKKKIDSVAVSQERFNLLASEIKDKEADLRYASWAIAEKDREVDQLSIAYRQSLVQLTSLNAEIKQLKDVLLKNEKELQPRNETVLKLEAELTSSLAKIDEATKNLDAVQKEYDEFKSSMEKKSASDATLLGEKDETIHQLEEQLKLALKELNINKVLISDLTSEKDNLKESLNVELGNVENLYQDLKITQDALEKSRGEACDLAEELQQSRYLCLDLEAEIGNIHDQFTQATELLQQNSDEAKQRVTVLAEELRVATELLSESNEKLKITSQELAAAVQKCDSLEKELVDADEKAESAALVLKQEKLIISSLNKDLMALETQLSKDNEAQKSLEAGVEEATKSLDEMNKHALVISEELELANNQILSLEDEKAELYRSLIQLKRAHQVALENLEDAHNLIVRLGNERESLQKRGEKLEEVLASAKGEILQLRSQINDENQKPVDVADKGDHPTRKVTRRRKANPQQKDP